MKTEIERAQERGIARPGAVMPRDIQELWRFAQAAASSGLFQVRSPEAAFMVLQTGMELGLLPAQAMRAIDIIEGKPRLSADLMVALVVARRDVCRYFTVIESTNDRAVYETHRVGAPAPVRETFSVEDAKLAGVWGRNTWARHPRDMLRHRAASKLARAVYPDLILGVYTPDEIEDIVESKRAAADHAPGESPADDIGALTAAAAEPDHDESAELDALDKALDTRVEAGKLTWPEAARLLLQSRDHLSDETWSSTAHRMALWACRKAIHTEASAAELNRWLDAEDVAGRYRAAKTAAEVEAVTEGVRAAATDAPSRWSWLRGKGAEAAHVREARAEAETRTTPQPEPPRGRKTRETPKTQETTAPAPAPAPEASTSAPSARLTEGEQEQLVRWRQHCWTRTNWQHLRNSWRAHRREFDGAHLEALALDSVVDRMVDLSRPRGATPEELDTLEAHAREFLAAEPAVKIVRAG